MSISQPVGFNAPNQPDDVLMIQALLNLNLARLPGIPFMVEDGTFGNATKGAIQEFQSVVLQNGPVCSCVVEPGSDSFSALASVVDGQLTETVLRAMMPQSTDLHAQTFLTPLLAAMRANGIDTALRQAHFLAQLGHESGSLIYTEELSSGVCYEGRADLGNTSPGDGSLFKGRGLIQITGRANYSRYGAARNRDFVSSLANARLLATDSNLAADCSGWFWSVHNLNVLADADDVVKITQTINGGQNGFSDRLNRLKLAKLLLKV